MSLASKRALITGGGRGIGRGVTLALAAKSCHVAIHYARKRAEAEQTAAAAAGFGVQVALVRANLRQEAEARRMVDEAVAQLGGLDILVGNAASGVLKPVTELEGKDW